MTILLAGSFGITHPAQAQSNPITIDMQVGFGGYYRDGALTPILITVKNDGDGFSGNLVLTGGGDKFTAPIDLPSGASKRVFLYGTLRSFVSTVQVDVVDSGGTRATVQRQAKPVAANEIIDAIVTDSSQVSQLRINFHPATHTNRANWLIENIPETAESLRSLNVMVFDNIDTGQLTAKQRIAVQAWVQDGGHLVVTGGPNWQKTASAFIDTDLLPLKPTDTTTLTSVTSLATFAGQIKDVLDGGNNPIVVTRGTLLTDATVLAQDSDTPLLIRHAYGDGVVDYLAIDPSLAPYTSWTHSDDFWYTILTSTGVQPTWTSGIVDTDRAATAANFIKGLRLPDVAQLCGFLGIYIILIGPLNYLVLKRLGRRELAWFTIPAIIVFYSIVSYITGFSLRGVQPTLNQLSIVRVYPNQDSGRADGIVAILSPRRATYTLRGGNGLALKSLKENNYSSSNALDTVTIREDVGQTVDFAADSVSVNAGLIAAFSASGTVKVKPITGHATITLDANGASADGNITADLTNTSGLTLSDAVLLYPGGSRELGVVTPNAHQDVNNVAFNFGTAASPNMAGLGAVSNSGQYYGYSYTYQSSNCGYNDPNIADILGKNCVPRYYYYGSPYYGSGSTNPDRQEFQRRQMLLDSVMNVADPNGGRGLNVYLAGWTNDSPFNVGLADVTAITESTTLYIYQIPVTITAASSTVKIPSGLISWAPDPTSNHPELSPYNLTLSYSDTVTFRFRPLLPLKSVSQLKIMLMSPTNTPGQGGVLLWNWDAQKWENVADLQANKSLNPNNLIDDPARFLDAEDTIRMQVVGNNGSNAGNSANSLEYRAIDLNLFGELGK
jgi:hypothetical protein